MTIKKIQQIESQITTLQQLITELKTDYIKQHKQDDVRLIKQMMFSLFPKSQERRVYNDKRLTFRRLKFCGVMGSVEHIKIVEKRLAELKIDAIVGTTGEQSSSYSNNKLTIKLNLV